MEDSWRRHLKLGVIQGMMFPDAPGNPARTLETAKQILMEDFFGVLVVGRMDDDTMKSVRDMAAQAHVSIAISAAPVILGGKHNLANLDEDARSAAIDALRKSIDDARVLGAPIVEVLDGARSYPGPENEERAVDQMVRSLEELCGYAKEGTEGPPVWVLLETFDRSVDKRSLVGPSDLAVQVAERVRSKHENFGLTIDMGHLPLIGEGYRDALETTKEYLLHVHLGSAVKHDTSHPSYGDTHPPFGMAGGEADVAELTEFLRALKEIGYFEKELPTGSPWLTFEVKPQSGQISELVIANCKRSFKEAWAKL
jgi:sugar phosphate isomerase/epimerase